MKPWWIAKIVKMVVFVAIAGEVAGLLGVADPIKPTTAAAIRALQAAGVRIVMLTGDSRAAAKAVADVPNVHPPYAFLVITGGALADGMQHGCGQLLRSLHQSRRGDSRLYLFIQRA